MKEIKESFEEDTKNWKVNARLITADEIAKITGNTNWTSTSDWFCLDTNQLDNTNYCAKTQGTSKYAWLFDYTNGCTSYGCNVADSSTWGYWTNSVYVGNPSYVWLIYSRGYFDYGSVADLHIGLRPVITISKDILN